MTSGYQAPATGVVRHTVTNFAGPSGPWECANYKNDNDTGTYPSTVDFAGTAGTPARAKAPNCASAADDSEHDAGVQAGQNLRFRATIAANGDITTTTLVNMDGTDHAGQYACKTTGQGANRTAAQCTDVSATLAAGVDGNINPATGVMTFALKSFTTLTITDTSLGTNVIAFGLGGNRGSCTTSCSGTLAAIGQAPLTLNLSTANAGGVAYSSGTGLATTTDNNYAMDGACSAVSGLANCSGSGLTDAYGAFEDSLGLNKAVPYGSPAGNNTAKYQWKITPSPLAGPTVSTSGGGSVPEGSVINLGATQTPSSGQSIASTAWTQSAGAPVVPTIKGASTTAAQTVAPDGTGQALTFNVHTVQGNSTVDDSTVGVTVTNVAPTANAGPDTVVNPGAATLKGTSSDPADPDCPTAGGRTYTWTRTAGPSTPTITAGVGALCRTATTSALVAGTYTFQLSVNDGDGGISTDTMNVEVRAAAAAGTLSGVIKDQATSAGLTGATASVYLGAPIGAPVATSAATPASGAWSVTGLAAGTYYVKFSKVGYQDEWYLGALGSSGAKGTTNTSSLIDGSIAATGTLKSISGTVVNNVPAAVSGVSVRLYDETGWLASTTTDGSGAYSFANLKPKSTYRGADRERRHVQPGVGRRHADRHVRNAHQRDRVEPGRGRHHGLHTGTDRHVDRHDQRVCVADDVRPGRRAGLRGLPGQPRRQREDERIGRVHDPEPASGLVPHLGMDQVGLGSGQHLGEELAVVQRPQR